MKEIYFFIYGIIVGACLMLLWKGKEKKSPRKTTEKPPEKCLACGGEIKEIPAGISKRTGQPYREFWVCENPDCSFTCNKRGGRFYCRWDKIQKPKGRTSDKTKTPKSQGDKKEEVQDTDEIDVSKIPF